MGFDRLRFVASAGVGETRSTFAVIPEGAAASKRFCSLIGELLDGPRSVTEFNYRMNDTRLLPMFVGLSTTAKVKAPKSATTFSEHGFEALPHPTNWPRHIRHMVGGRSLYQATRGCCCVLSFQSDPV
jgi:threonine dehydratase